MASVCTPPNTCLLGYTESTTQTASRSVQPFLHSSRQSVSILYNRRLFNLKIAPSHGRPGPHLMHDSLGVSEPTTQTASRLNQPFLHSSAQGVRILYNGPPLGPSKLPLPMGDLDPSSKTRFFGPTRVLNPNGISIGSAVFAELITVTDRQTTLLYSVCHNLYVGLRSTAMRLDFVRCHRSTVANIVTPGQKCLQAGDRESLGRNSPKQEMPKGK